MDEVVSKWCEIAENTTTYLSKNVQDLVLKKGISTTSSDFSLEIATDDLLDISRLSSFLLSDDGYLHHPTQRNAEWYIQHIKNTEPFFTIVKMKMKVISEEELQGLIKLCAWMHQPQIVDLCFDLLTRKEEVALNSHECLLLITAALERALGNLFLHGDRKKKVPSLLRDLLSSPELLLLLGTSQVILLQLLLGSPLSLNLRNLIWHGFVGFLDWDTHGYASVLLFLCAAIGRHLDECRSIETVDEIIPRRWATFKHHQQEHKWPKWSQFMVDNEEMLVEAVSKTRVLPSSRKAIWLRAIRHHQKGRYGRCCALMIPEIEHTLRLIYCAVNGCPARAMTAESVVHYTTLDVILECGGESNDKPRIAEFLGNGLYSALVDVFVHLEGPRVRDRFSHGECRLWDIDVQLSTHLLALSTAILWLPDRPSVVIPHYSSHFSPAALFHRELVETIEAIGHWLCLVDVVHQSVLVDLSAWPAEWHPLVGSWLRNWSPAVNQLLINQLKEENGRQMDDFVVIKADQLSATWRRTMSQIALGCQRLTSHYNKRNGPGTLSSLHSRQRSTHARMDSYMYLFIAAVQLSLLFPIAVSFGGQVIVNDPPTVRRMKRSVTRWADNFASASANNRWIELAECAKDSIQSMEILISSVLVFASKI